MSELGLGEIITTPQSRDAIHVAVAPVVAGTTLFPGQKVIIDPATEAAVPAAIGEKPIGVVDPFIKDVVLTGRQFWLWLRPGSITSLAHVWTHPAFGDKPPLPPTAAVAVIEPVPAAIINPDAWRTVEIVGLMMDIRETKTPVKLEALIAAVAKSACTDPTVLELVAEYQKMTPADLGKYPIAAYFVAKLWGVTPIGEAAAAMDHVLENNACPFFPAVADMIESYRLLGRYTHGEGGPFDDILSGAWVTLFKAYAEVLGIPYKPIGVTYVTADDYGCSEC